MAKTGLTDLYVIMADQKVGMRQRLNAAISASRVERLSMPGEEPPQAIVFLRWVIDFEDRDGSRLSPNFRREAAAAISYYERRVAKMALTFDVADQDEKRRSWLRLINSSIRYHLWLHGRWPADKHLLLGPDDQFEMPPTDPDMTLSAVLTGGGNRHQRRKLRAIDEPASGMWSGTEAERLELIRPLAKAVQERLQKFGLA